MSITGRRYLSTQFYHCLHTVNIVKKEKKKKKKGMNITVIIVELQTGLFDVLRSTFPWTKWVVDDPSVYFQFFFLLSLYERFVSKFSKQDIYQIGKSMKEKYICIFEKRKFQFYLCIQKIRNISFYIVFFPPKIRNRKSTKVLERRIDVSIDSKTVPCLPTNYWKK